MNVKQDEKNVNVPLDLQVGMRSNESWLQVKTIWAKTWTVVRRFPLLFGIIGTVSVYMIAFHSYIASLIIGFIYPAYATVKVVVRVQDPDQEVVGDFAKIHLKWLIYWLVYATILVFEQPIGTLFRLIAPCYGLLRTVFFVWCFMSTKNNGSDFLLETFMCLRLSTEQFQGTPKKTAP